MVMSQVEADCLFCRIVRGEIPATFVAQGEGYRAFADINPQAPQHLLVIPTEHVAAISQHTDGVKLGALVTAAAELGRRVGGDKGFRLVVNEGDDGGQTVHHLHVHVLAGRRMTWPPG